MLRNGTFAEPRPLAELVPRACSSGSPCARGSDSPLCALPQGESRSLVRGLPSNWVRDWGSSVGSARGAARARGQRRCWSGALTRSFDRGLGVRGSTVALATLVGGMDTGATWCEWCAAELAERHAQAEGSSDRARGGLGVCTPRRRCDIGVGEGAALGRGRSRGRLERSDLDDRRCVELDCRRSSVGAPVPSCARAQREQQQERACGDERELPIDMHLEWSAGRN